MRYLLLLRHGKSAWDNPDLADHNRPLAPRGRKAAKMIGRFLAGKKLLPDLILTSTALRAQQTAEQVALSLPPTTSLRALKSLYPGAPSRMAAVLARVPAETRTVLMIGHEPGLPNFARRLAQTGKGKHLRRLQRAYPTAGLCLLDWQAEDWAAPLDAAATLRAFIRPKDLR